jgi:hypothetical protein
MAHADRSAVKIGGVGICRSTGRRLREVSRHHQLTQRSLHFPLALPLELIAVVSLDHPEGVPLWAGRGVCADLLGVENRVRSIVARQVGGEMPWWEWVRVDRDPGDDAWPKLLTDAIAFVRAHPPVPPMTLWDAL